VTFQAGCHDYFALVDFGTMPASYPLSSVWEIGKCQGRKNITG
jgi:hypothetical protein